MTEGFLKNVASSIDNITLESVGNMTQYFNLNDFFNENFQGMAEIMITPYQVMVIYASSDAKMLHNSVISYMRDNILDLRMEKPIIAIRCCSERDRKFFYPEILNRGYSVTSSMISVLEIFYSQIRRCNCVDLMGATLQEFKKYNGITTTVERMSEIPDSRVCKKINGMAINEYIYLMKEREEKEDKEEGR